MNKTLEVNNCWPLSLSRKVHPFAQIQHELNKTMNELNEWFELTTPFKCHPVNLDINPQIDVIDDKDHFKVEIELPGVDENEVDIDVSNGCLNIRAEKKTSKKDAGQNYALREIGYGKYCRSIPLPDNIEIDEAKASFKKGMLWIDIPKSADSINHVKSIKIEKGS